VPDATRAFHSYGVLWRADMLVFYVDRRPVGWMRSPAGLDRPMYLIANLAVGGRFPGPPDATTRFPAAFEIDWIAAFRSTGEGA
jgi:beta-glucanase (GH16 family)